MLFVHGGPWGRDTWGYNPTAQWLANRGYAVLQVNYRGVDRLRQEVPQRRQPAVGPQDAGRPHRRRELGGRAKGSPTRRRSRIYGGSYGGYAALAGLTFTPGHSSRCAVDIVGPVEPDDAHRARSRRTGSRCARSSTCASATWTTRRTTSCIKDASPLFKADRIKMPLLIGQGANDPRVKQAESEQIVAGHREERRHGRPTSSTPTRGTASPGPRTASTSTRAPRPSSPPASAGARSRSRAASATRARPRS